VAAIAATGVPLPRRSRLRIRHEPQCFEAGETGDPSAAEVLTTDHPGADFMVDIIKVLWASSTVAANPAPATGPA